MPSTKKDFEAARLGVFATPGLLLTNVNCGIRVKNNMVSAIALLMLFAVLEPAMAADHDTDKNWKAKWERVLRDAKAEGKVAVLGPPLQDVRPSLMGAFKKSFPDVS